MSNKLKEYRGQEVSLTKRQQNIKALRAQLNEADTGAIQPFTVYKIITYLCVIILPLVPLAIYRIWNAKTQFTSIEQKIWTAVIIAITVYMIKLTCFS